MLYYFKADQKPSLVSRWSTTYVLGDGTIVIYIGSIFGLFASWYVYDNARPVDLVETINHKNAVQVPQSDEACKVRFCREEIERETQTAISAVDPRGGARWGNPAGLLKLDYTERRITNWETGRSASGDGDCPQAWNIPAHDIPQAQPVHQGLGFFASFLETTFLRNIRKVKGVQSAHHGAPQLDALLYTNRDESIFIMLYGVTPDSIAMLSKSKWNISPIAFYGFDDWLKFRRLQRSSPSFGKSCNDLSEQWRAAVQGPFGSLSKFCTRHKRWKFPQRVPTRKQTRYYWDFMKNYSSFKQFQSEKAG